MKKVLLAGGCSFTVGNNTWPDHVAAALNLSVVNFGQSSRGNGYISRSVIYGVSNLLKEYHSQDILVGIMWSGPSRHEFYSHDTRDALISKTSENPHSFVDENHKKWIGLNHHWNDPISKLYYKNFYDKDASIIYTLEHILRVQWFLRLHKIDYFMSIFSDIVLPTKDQLNNPDISCLYDMLDLSKFVSTKGCIDWCIEDSGISMAHEHPDLDREAMHPTKRHHKAYTDNIILPHINKYVKGDHYE